MGLLASKPVGKIGKATTRPNQLTRGKRGLSALANVPEDSVLEILEYEAESNKSDSEEVETANSYNLRRGAATKVRLVI